MERHKPVSNTMKMDCNPQISMPPLPGTSAANNAAAVGLNDSDAANIHPGEFIANPKAKEITATRRVAIDQQTHCMNSTNSTDIKLSASAPATVIAAPGPGAAGPGAPDPAPVSTPAPAQTRAPIQILNPTPIVIPMSKEERENRSKDLVERAFILGVVKANSKFQLLRRHAKKEISNYMLSTACTSSTHSTNMNGCASSCTSTCTGGSGNTENGGYISNQRQEGLQWDFSPNGESTLGGSGNISMGTTCTQHCTGLDAVQIYNTCPDILVEEKSRIILDEDLIVF